MNFKKKNHFGRARTREFFIWFSAPLPLPEFWISHLQSRVFALGNRIKMSWRKWLKGEDIFPSSPYHKPASSELISGSAQTGSIRCSLPRYTNQPEKGQWVRNNIWPVMQIHHVSHNFAPNSCFFLLVRFSFLQSKWIQYESSFTYSLGLSTAQKRCER